MANPKLTVLLEKLRGTTFELDKPELTIGRRASCDICIPDSSLSGQHATLIQIEDGGYLLRDEDSTNGTRVNNVPITEQVLKNSSIIQFGGVEVLYDDKKIDPIVTSGAIGGRTHTISLDTLSNGSTAVRGVTRQAGTSKEDTKEHNMVQKMIYISLAILGLALLASAVFVLLKMFAPAS